MRLRGRECGAAISPVKMHSPPFWGAPIRPEWHIVAIMHAGQPLHIRLVADTRLLAFPSGRMFAT
ncbi:hypothetical protein D9M69_173650 [compost metagenome]